MKIRIAILFIIFSFNSCSKPTPFLVKRIIDLKSVELEDGSTVKLIGINSFNSKYEKALLALKDQQIFLYDENYDPIVEVNSASLNAYIYDTDGNCINNFAEETSSDNIASHELNNSNTNIENPDDSKIITGDEAVKEHISGNEISKLPGHNLSELYEKNKYAVFLIGVPLDELNWAQGTGFFITPDGIAVSNYHVFEKGLKNQAVVKTIDNNQYRISRIIKFDKDLDFIIFKVENTHNDFPFLSIAKTKINVGDDVFAIGNPKGLEHTLSKGIVSSFRKNNSMIQTTTEITHGSSGGPLFNMQGEVIGITTSGMGEADLNFAMNIQMLQIEKYTGEQTIKSESKNNL